MLFCCFMKENVDFMNENVTVWINLKVDNLAQIEFESTPDLCLVLKPKNSVVSHTTVHKGPEVHMIVEGIEKSCPSRSMR